MEARTQPPATACALCSRAAAFQRRGLCRSCYRKLWEADVPLPPKLSAPRSRVQRVRDWIRSLDPEARALLVAALEAA